MFFPLATIKSTCAAFKVILIPAVDYIAPSLWWHLSCLYFWSQIIDPTTYWISLIDHLRYPRSECHSRVLSFPHPSYLINYQSFLLIPKYYWVSSFLSLLIITTLGQDIIIKGLKNYKRYSCFHSCHPLFYHPHCSQQGLSNCKSDHSVHLLKKF